MSKVIVHIDLNAFFVRAEEIKDPSLEGLPVAIGHDGRGGIVSTCSYKAREYGVRSGMPMFQAKELCKELIIRPVDFRFYGALSHEFFKFVSSYTKIIEKASVDECFADFTNAIKGVKDVEQYFREFQKELFKKTKLRCSIGVAPTKFLAKMGSDYRKPNGLTIIRRRDVKDILYPLSIDKMFGVGKKTFPRLNELGIKTIGDLAIAIEKEDKNIKDCLGKFYDTAKEWLNGYGDDVVSVEKWDPKSIGNSTTLKSDTNSFDIIKETFEWLSKEVAERAYKEGKMGSTIQIVVKEATYPFVSHNKSITLEAPTNKWKDIYKAATDLYEKHFFNLTVRLVGVTLQKLINNEEVNIQMTLFDYQKHEEENETRLLINEWNRQLKEPLLKRASEVKGKKKDE